MVSPVPNRNKVFISYCHKDVRYLIQLLPHLQYIEDAGLIDLWVDTKIRPGEDWAKEIRNAIALTKVAILLISVDFLNSPIVEKYELPQLLLAAESEGIKIVPVILRPCRLPAKLFRLQAINSHKSLARMTVPEREEFWVKVANFAEETISTNISTNGLTCEEKPLKDEISDEIDTYAEQMEEALQEFRQRTLTDVPSVLSEQSKIWKKEDHAEHN